MKLASPFNYYWKTYADGKCPFCKSDRITTAENGQIIFCTVYGNGGYVLSDACNEYAKAGDGQCKYCRDAGGINRKGVKGPAFLCDDCNHGVNFEAPELITDLFKHNSKTQCIHCEWHNSRIKKRRG